MSEELSTKCRNCGLGSNRILIAERGYFCHSCGEAMCMIYGCTESKPCPEGCYWVAPGRCSGCESWLIEAIEEVFGNAPKILLSFLLLLALFSATHAQSKPKKHKVLSNLATAAFSASAVFDYLATKQIIDRGVAVEGNPLLRTRSGGVSTARYITFNIGILIVTKLIERKHERAGIGLRVALAFGHTSAGVYAATIH